MKQKAILALFLLSFSACGVYAQDVSSIIQDPAGFFLDFHHDNSDMFPVPKEKHFSLRLNLSPFTLIFNGIGMKLKLLGEREKLPQIDVYGTYGTILALSMISSEPGSTSASWNDTTVGFHLTKSVDPKTRLFLGMQSTNLSIKVNVADSENQDMKDIFKNPISAGDVYFLTGIEYHTRPDKYIVVETAYGMGRRKIINRVSMWYKFMELGFSLYPESILVIHPFAACHLAF